MTRLELIRSLVKRQVGPTHLRGVEPKIPVAPVPPPAPTIYPLPKVRRANVVDWRPKPVLLVP